MNPVNLNPLPSRRTQEDSNALKMEREGFVDEAVVLALVNSPRHTRSNPYPADLALAADDLDFAGWQVTSAGPARRPEVPPQVISAIIRRASPPALEESKSSGHPDSSHHWWMAGLVGIVSAVLLSVLCIALFSRAHHPEIKTPASSQSTSLMSPVEDHSNSESRVTPSPAEAPLRSR